MTVAAPCKLCGRETFREAGIGDDYYCHRDPGDSCYMKASMQTKVNELLARIDAIKEAY